MSRSGPRSSKLRAGRGFTLIEMIIAVTLVAAIITGLLMAMRTGLTAYQKVNQRLEDNRRAMGLDQAMHRQFGGIMPVAISCPGQGLKPAFGGDVNWMRFVSSSSFSDGARGYPRVIEYAVAPDSNGGVRLMMQERVYSGPAGLQPLCSPQGLVPVQLSSDAIAMAGKLAVCRFGYRVPVPDSPMGGDWIPAWQRPDYLPRDVRIEMQSTPGASTSLPLLTLNVPVRVTRSVLFPYADY